MYSIDAYDSHGQLKPSGLLWLSMLFSARGWGAFVMAGASQAQGANLLQLFFPQTQSLYLLMGLGLPAVILMWLSGLRHKKNKIVNGLWRYGRPILLMTYALDVVLQVYHLTLMRGAFSWPAAVTLLLSLWLMAYLVRSSRVRHTFAN
ncbi:DUF2919 domain-containing protein [Photobacterium galatheae]|uniref:Membrane protein n=1 Tax=Photobacterium galatheae TaxID=1654360 RepID=A0A066S031_9GAMM|nr:DUF2919 domain-containing protein [Photobacterium galatheae]KDM93008.1 membrane protein [Photobacterium galatheae]MCM0148464.1 DUF2919 domain-containing protein [Photobacterium galatheae]